jgi:hypothetical protein
MFLNKIFPKNSFLRNMRYLTLVFTTLIFNSVFAQGEEGDASENVSLAELEADLAILGDKVVAGKLEEERLQSNKEFTSVLEEMLYYNEAFEYPFEKVKNLSKITAESEELRLFTWLVPLKDGTYNYNGFALIKRKKGVIEVVDLTDNSKSLESPEYDWLKPENWFGAIYYQTFEVKHKKRRYQVYLGYRPGDREVQEKLIEVVHVDNNKLTFGAKIFETPIISDYKYDQRPYRLRFRYSKKVVASLKYKPELNMIVMDHLSPPDASFQRDWKRYGPDFSYDGIYWENGKFYLKKQIEFDSGFQPATPIEKPKQGLTPKK